MANQPSLPRPLFYAALALLAIGSAGVGWLWQSHRMNSNPAAGLSAGQRAATEQVVREYILAHPEILPEAMENLKHKDDANRLSGIRGDVERAFPGAVLGNPDGRQILVEFTDYACTYCRKSVDDVAELIRKNPQLKVVIRELPILSPESSDAAKMALAAARQGKYAPFHQALFALDGPDARNIATAAQHAGLDLARAKKDAADPAIASEIERNFTLARQLGFNGTPSWVAGEKMLAGAIGKEQLAEAIGFGR